MKSCLSCAVLLSITTVALADTTWVAGGDVSGEWTSAGSPYMIRGDLRIPPTEILSIGPGVTVFFAVRCSLLVDSAARLNAIGAENDSIYFTTDTLMLPERWGGIDLNSGADTCRLEWCVIEFANRFHDAMDRVPLLMRSTTYRFNVGGNAGAMYLFDQDIEFIGCVFESNHCPAHAGALRIDGITGLMEDCVFRNNWTSGRWGGAINWGCQYGPLVLRRCDFIANFAPLGGAVLTEIADSNLVFENCRFINNAAESGGAVNAEYVSPPKFRECLFEGNQATGEGGAMVLLGGVNDIITVDQCVFRNNTAGTNGGAILYRPIEFGQYYPPIIVRCTFVGNSAAEQGGAIYLATWCRVWSCIFADTDDGAAMRLPAYSNPPGQIFRRPAYNLFYANEEGDFSENVGGDYGEIADTNRNGDSCDAHFNLFLDPELVDPENGDFHLLETSPCIDAGPDSSQRFPFRDPDSTIADIGAFYFDQTQATEEERTAVRGYQLAQNYPNPFNSSTQIRFDLPVTAHVKLAIFDLLGREVAVLVNERLNAGTHIATFHAGDLPSGMYLYRLQAAAALQTHKMILLK